MLNVAFQYSKRMQLNLKHEELELANKQKDDAWKSGAV